MSIVYRPAIAGLDAVSLLTIDPAGSTPNSSGASISSTQVLTLQPADGTNPGIVSTSAQTMAGAKTFSTAPILSSLTASLPLKLDASKNITAAAIALGGTEVSGVLTYDKGGTAQSSYAAGDLLYASATNTVSKLAIGTNAYVLTVSAGLPSWQPATGGMAAGVGLLYRGQPTGTLNGSFNKTTFPTSVVDTASAYSSGVFTVPSTGYYSVSACTYVNGTYSVGAYVGMAIYVNGSVVQERYDIQGGANTQQSIDIAVNMLPLTASDTLEIRVASSATSPTYDSNANRSFISIAKTGT